MATEELREILLSSPAQKKQLQSFMEKMGLTLDDDLEYAVGIFSEEDDHLIACGGHARNILKGFAIEPSQRGRNLLGTLVSKIITHQTELGFVKLRVFTAPDKIPLFEHSGFDLVAEAGEAALLENFRNGVDQYIQKVLEHIPCIFRRATLPIAGALVMNCNPFTLGHLHLIQYVAKKCSLVYIFVVEDDRSLFSFDIRYKFVKESCSNIENIIVLPSGPYMISSATFPSYFIKDKCRIEEVRTELDATIFASRIAPSLHILNRFAGTEPACNVTAAYNKSLAKILPKFGVHFIEIPRFAVEGKIVSASDVRSILAHCGPFSSKLDNLLPQSVLSWLRSSQAETILHKLHSTDTLQN